MCIRDSFRRVWPVTAPKRQDAPRRRIRTDVTVSRGGFMGAACGVSKVPRADRLVLDNATTRTAAMGVLVWPSYNRFQVCLQVSPYLAASGEGVAHATDEVVCEYVNGRRVDTVESIGRIFREARRVCSIALQVPSSTYLEGHLAD